MQALASQTQLENILAGVRRGRATARPQVSRTSLPGWLQSRLSPALMRLVAAFALAIVAALIADFSRLLAVFLAIASAAAFFSLWVPSGPAPLDGKPRWRGQELDDDRPRFDFAFRRRPKPPRR